MLEGISLQEGIMVMHHSLFQKCVAFGFVVAAFACRTSVPSGDAELVVSADAVTAEDIDSISVAVTGPGIDPDDPSFTTDLVLTDGQWRGSLLEIPAGDDREFTATALDADGAEIFRGVASGVSVGQGTQEIAIILQEVNPPPPFFNVAPIIDAVVRSSAVVQPDEEATIVVQARDRNADDTLTFAWTDGGGTIGSQDDTANGSRITWSATQQQAYQLTVTVTDNKGAATQISIEMTVGEATGGADFVLTFNTLPIVRDVTATPSHADIGETVRLAVPDIENLEDDALTFEWAIGDNDDGNPDCEGTFSDADEDAISFTLTGPEPPLGLCRLVVRVLDGNEQGIASEGNFVIQTGAVNNGIFPVLADFERDLRSNGAGAGGHTDDAILNEASGDTCGNGPAAVTLTHASDPNASRYARFDYTVAADNSNTCDPFAAFGLPLRATPEAMDLSRFSGVSLSSRRFGNGQNDFVVEIRTIALDNNNQPVDCPALRSRTITAPATWQSVTLNFDSVDDFPSQTGDLGCAYDRSNVSAFSVVVQDAGTGSVGIDDIEFVTQ